MTKQEKIQHAYGGQWDRLKDKIDDNGWSTEKLSYEGSDGDTYGFFDYDSKDFNGKTMYRPFDLRGIEDNNGWFEINENTVFSPGLYWIVCEFYLFGTLDRKCIAHYVDKSNPKFYQNNDKTTRYTHYKKIPEPTKLPLY
ncbi:hypothetical protein [Flavobacterium sp. WV_118_3]|uniref:hypothetical protein n=1 Tax=Flavobacterium sp. WV_118_3 TaxID=3151764 RepID=UPI00321A8054